MSWSERARQVIADVHATLPANISFADRRKAIRAAYPFGPREHWPYKAWCKAQRAYLAKYDPKAPGPLPLRPTKQHAVLKRRTEDGDVVFPFARTGGQQ